MPRRPGATLLEVLVAIFVMAIGLIALLTLFPIGALRMAQAIQDEQSAQAAGNAQAVSVMKNLRNEPGLQNPSDGFKNPTPGGPLLDADPQGPSYPVFIDPVGWRTANGLGAQTIVAGSSAVTRRTVSFVNTNFDANQWFTLPDDIDFENAATGPTNATAGTPRWLLPGGPAFIRDLRYSYAYLCQRPRYSDKSVVDTAIVVYNKRPLSQAGGISLPEYAYVNSAFNIANNTVTIDYSKGGVPPPPLRSGDWILDATPIQNAAANTGTAHGYFYRVVGITDNTAAQNMVVEVGTPLRGFAASQVGTVIVLDGVTEVFEKGPARQP
jgi:type II secretory pathway pseudopilin PulG